MVGILRSVWGPAYLVPFIPLLVGLDKGAWWFSAVGAGTTLVEAWGRGTVHENASQKHAQGNAGNNNLTHTREFQTKIVF